MMKEDILKYKKLFLKRERECLEIARHDENKIVSPLREFEFQYDGEIYELEKIFLQVMRSINYHIEDYLPPQIDDFDGYRRVGEFWFKELPMVFVDKFKPLRKTPPSRDEKETVDFFSMNDTEASVYFNNKYKDIEGDSYDLVWFLNDFILSERCWFYNSHFIDGDRIKIGIDCSEDPCPTYTLIELVELCGGKYLNRECNDGKKKSFNFWGRLRGLLR